MRHILIVDDDPLLRKGTARIMEKAGYTTVTAKNGTDALDALNGQDFDLVLLDVDLPDINGREVCKRIRQNPGCEGIYVVMVSSTRIAPDDKILGLEDGADGYISRPVANRELLARVKAILRLKSMEEAMRHAETQQAEVRRKESIVQISSGIAHDFNNLLTVIIGNIDMAKMYNEPTHPAADHLDDAMEACRWAAGITEKFLTLSQSICLNLTAGNLPELIDTVVAARHLPADIQFQKALEAELPIVCFDERYLQQAIDCLVANAVEAMPDGGTLAVRLERLSEDHFDARSDDGAPSREFIALTFEDTGSGISDNDRPKVFDPYFSTKKMGQQKGMGLGLATANAIIAQHGGWLELESEIDRGTRATIFLPISECQDEADADGCSASVEPSP